MQASQCALMSRSDAASPQSLKNDGVFCVDDIESHGVARLQVELDGGG